VKDLEKAAQTYADANDIKKATFGKTLGEAFKAGAQWVLGKAEHKSESVELEAFREAAWQTRKLCELIVNSPSKTPIKGEIESAAFALSYHPKVLNTREPEDHNGCFTGDCPHEKQAECDAALKNRTASSVCREGAAMIRRPILGLIREDQGLERDKIIQGVRAKCASAAAMLPMDELARARIHTNVEVCALLDEIDQLNRIVQMTVDCENDRVISGSDRISVVLWRLVVKRICENGYKKLIQPQARPGREAEEDDHGPNKN
jgi:hypothetical protein